MDERIEIHHPQRGSGGWNRAIVDDSEVIALDAIPDAAHQQLAKLCRYINYLGIPVIVRWALEMSGSWFEFGRSQNI
jgi:hypothetical protein